MTSKETQPKFKRTAAVMVPTLSFKERTHAYVKILEAIHLGKVLKPASGQEAKKPAHVCRVIDLEDGTEKDLICPAIMVNTFAEGDTKEYVGKCFEIIATKKEDKTYKMVEIHVIEDPLK